MISQLIQEEKLNDAYTQIEQEMVPACYSLVEEYQQALYKEPIPIIPNTIDEIKEEAVEDVLFFCSTCSLDFPSLSYLKRHYITKKHQRALVMEQKGKKFNQKKKYVRKNEMKENDVEILNDSEELSPEEVELLEIFQRNQTEVESIDNFGYNFETEAVPNFDDFFMENNSTSCKPKPIETEEFLHKVPRQLFNYSDPEDDYELTSPKKIKIEEVPQPVEILPQPIAIQPVMGQQMIIQIPQKYFIIPQHQQKFNQSIQHQLNNILKAKNSDFKVPQPVKRTFQTMQAVQAQKPKVPTFVPQQQQPIRQHFLNVNHNQPQSPP